MASDDYECLREDYFDLYLPWYSFVGKSQVYPWYSHLRKATALFGLILGLRPGKGEGRSPLELDSVPGVDWNELFDRNGFSKLHKAVYGISSQPLDAEVEARPEDLDRPDSVGLTALWYACWLGNSNHIRILIEHGADVNNASIPPICAAVRRGSYDSVKQLLNAGALITDRSIGTLYETLMYLPSRLGEEHVKEMLAIDKALFGRVFSINHRPSICGQAPPLIALARQRLPYSHARMRQLLEFGADTELSDKRGLTPLCHAIYAGNTEGCKILGRAGANSNVQTYTGHTILHLAIRNATDANIIQAVSELDLSGVGLGTKDSSDCTAFELFSIRAGRHRNDDDLFPGIFQPDSPYRMSRLDNLRDAASKYVKNTETEVQILLSFQTLLQQVQDAQGIPIEDRYPLLNLTRESIKIDQDEDRSRETVMPSVPGAWPEN